jgi:RHS repeat-associated protein
MGSVRYEVINGQLIAEKRNGVRRLYVPDPLGNTIALLDNTQAQTDTFTYWPYGEERIRTGTTATPFRYWGVLGVYRDSSSRSYAKARCMSVLTARWLTPDPVLIQISGPNQFLMVYDNPATYLDATGLLPALGQIGTKNESCRDRAAYYCSYARSTCENKNRAMNCICRSAISFCDFIQQGSWPRMWNEREKKWANCMNKCIFDHFRSGDTDRWKDAKKICESKGQGSKECCKATTGAEQDGFTKCPDVCKRFGPPPGRPAIFPFSGSFEDRWKRAQQFCCEGPKGDPLGPPGHEIVGT